MDKICKSYKNASKAYEPSAEDKALLESKGLDITKLEFFELKAANTIRDRDGDLFEVKFLTEMARQAKSEMISGLYGHNPEKGVLFKVFDSYVESDQYGVHWLIYKIYVHKDATFVDNGMKVIDCIKSRYFDFVSVGFYGGGEAHEFEDGSFGYLFSGEKKVENLEISFVYMGAQYGARAKDANKNKILNMEKTVKFIANEKAYDATVTVLNDEVAVNVDKSLNEDMTRISSENESLKQANSDLKSEKESLLCELKKFKEPLVESIKKIYEKQEVSKELRETDDTLYSKSVTWLNEFIKDREKVESKKNQIIGKTENEFSNQNEVKL